MHVASIADPTPVMSHHGATMASMAKSTAQEAQAIAGFSTTAPRQTPCANCSPTRTKKKKVQTPKPHCVCCVLFTSHSPLFCAGADNSFTSRMSHSTSLVAIVKPFSLLGDASSWKTLAFATYSHPSLTGVSTYTPPVSPGGAVTHRLQRPV